VRGRSYLATEIPIFAAHGLYDPILPFQRSKESLHVLKKAGFELTWREYPMAHQIVPDEIDDIREFLLRET
jgi:phospholipase/carboxylesterase